MAESQLRRIARPFHTAFPWLPKDPGEAVERLARVRDKGVRQATDGEFRVEHLPVGTLGKAATSIENSIRYLLDKYNRTGILDPGLRSFYAAKGVPFDTLARLEYGELPMDAASRAARAREMGLDPDMVWTRQDLVGLDHARLQHRGGLTYAGFTPYLADQAAVSKGQTYPLIASPKIVGLQPFDGIAADDFVNIESSPIPEQIRRFVEDRRARSKEAQGNAKPWPLASVLNELGTSSNKWDASASHIDALQRAIGLADSFQWLNRKASPDSLTKLREAAAGAETTTGPRYGWGGAHADVAPKWKVLESVSMEDNPLSSGEEFASKIIQDRAREAGARGTLVGDEGGVSVAFMEPAELRHADLALLDPVHAGEAGYMRSAPPIALAAAASQSQGAEMEDIPRATSKAGKQRTLDFIYQEQREGQPLYEYLSKQEQGVVPSDRGAYASAVEDSLNRPVISVQYAREEVGDELVPSDAFPSGFLSVRDYINLEGQKAYSQFVRSFKDSTGKLTPEVIQMAEQARDRVFRAADDAEGMLAGTLKTNSPYANLMQSTIQQAVAAHSPGGKYAQFGGRTQSEDAEAQQQYGSGSNFMLTAAGRQNYEAQRLLDLWSATDENYGPASTMSQVQRAIGGFTAPIYNRLTGNSTRLAGEEWDEMGRMSKPDGKYGYAAEMYYRSANDTPGQETSVYTPEGRSKFVDTEMTTPTGLANATMGNTDYPMANWYQSVGMRAREIPNTIGNWLGGGDENLIQNLQELRRNYNRTTPVMPDGADSKEFTEIGKQLQSADARMSGYNAAQLGPKMADAWNSTIGLIPGLKTDRFYLPDAAVDALDMPIEALTDPINVSMNVMAPGIGAVKGAVTGGAKQAGNNLIRSLAKLPTRMGDDAMEETAHGMGLASAMSSPFDYFFPPRTNLLMGTKDPNDKDYDAHLKINTEQAKFDQMDAADRYGRMVGRKK